LACGGLNHPDVLFLAWWALSGCIDAVREVARGVMTAFPDLVLTMDDVRVGLCKSFGPSRTPINSGLAPP
jgi:hypothetical protein